MQNSYGLGYRRSNDELIRDCAAHGTAFVPFFSIVTGGREAGANGGEHPQNVAAGALRLSPADLARLDAV